jgi:protein gp37
MGDRSSIEWTSATWNPIRGCSRVSEGCRNCYAERTAIRHAGTTCARCPNGFSSHAASRCRECDCPGYQQGDEGAYAGLVKSTPAGPRWTGAVRFVEELLDAPLRWKRPRRIFVNSMSDLFHEKVPDAWIDRIFAVMAAARQHTFQVLTKRPERMLAWFNREEKADALVAWQMGRMIGGAKEYKTGRAIVSTFRDGGWPLPNVQLGVSVEDQPTADARIPLLLRTPAAVRFVSYEPALGLVDFTKVCDRRGRRALWMNTVEAKEANPGHAELVASLGPDYPYTRLDWIIPGGESGPGARPCDLAWIRSVVGQARAAGVPVFVKQLGARPCNCAGVHCPTTEAPWERLTLRDRKGGDPTEWPEDLRVREFPHA